MLFRRRIKPNWAESVRVWLWPRHSFSRSFRYVSKRILRLSATPHAIAAGVAAGAFASFTPFVGFHLMICFLVAWLLRGNFIAAGLGTFVGNPLTFPLIWLSTFNTGKFLLGGAAVGHMRLGDISRALFEKSFAEIIPLLTTMAVGGVLLGTIVGVLIYFVTRWMVNAYQEARRRRLQASRPTAPAVGQAKVE